MEPDFSVDAFHRGRFVVVQPEKGGHRSGMDALVLAASVPTAFNGHVVDFGAGAGAVGLAVAARCPQSRVALVEASPEMADCARRSLDHSANRHLASRMTVIEADVTQLSASGPKTSLAPRFADFILMNPPFNAPEDRASPDVLRQRAHVMTKGLLDNWMRAAAGVARPRAGVAIIARPAALAPILDSLAGRFGAAELIAVHARAEAPAIRVVVRARYGSRASPSILAPLVLHEGPANAFSARADAISAGETSLFGD